MKTRSCFAVPFLVLAMLVSLPPISAAPVPTFSVRNLVDGADLIVSGTVRTDADFAASPEPLLPSYCQLSVDTVVKGSVQKGTVINIIAPDGFQLRDLRIADGMYRMFPVVKRGDSYAVLSPYYQSLPAVPGVQLMSDAPFDRTVEMLADVVRSASVFPEVRLEAIFNLWGLKNRFASDALHESLESGPDETKLAAVGVLISGGDVSVLPLAERALLRPTMSADTAVMHNLRVAIRDHVTDPAGAPTLARLLASGDLETRRASSQGLRLTRSTDAIAPLLQALDDPDVQVRHNAVVGLASLTRSPEWGASMPAFVADEAKYVQHWRQWSASPKP